MHLSFLTFGPDPFVLRHPPPRETSLLLDLKPFYFVSIMGISVDGELLPIQASMWDAAASGGAILDSRMSLTVLAEPAYQAVTKALSRRLAGVPRGEVPGDHGGAVAEHVEGGEHTTTGALVGVRH
ncbi:aspartic proteinase nepenthesin-2-like [Canna indica]|uniref:Aspartic proteinase nepenthesin-2-like n=1 Tax=Canna indica TaxID=4628 RepID=A0AAQ3KAQ7_9LILI|nr:aspartic proteinase nepenthesin-2-like [Canna indica]